VTSRAISRSSWSATKSEDASKLVVRVRFPSPALRSPNFESRFGHAERVVPEPDFKVRRCRSPGELRWTGLRRSHPRPPP
jgi:hypothetical protein